MIYKKTLLAVLMCALMLMAFSACESGDSQTETPTETASELDEAPIDASVELSELLTSTLANALPPLETSAEEVPPGTLSPANQLKRAPQELVGQKVELSMSVTTDVVYRYNAETKQLLVIAGIVPEGTILLAMQLDSTSMDAFLTRMASTDKTVTGTVNGLYILDGMITAFNSVNSADAPAATASSTICYGAMMDAVNIFVQLDGNGTDDSFFAFKQSVARFGF